MITIYKNKGDFTSRNFPNIICVDVNDVYFNSITSQLIDDRARAIISKIDGAVLEEKYKIRSKFNDTLLDIDKLSTGCKTALNVLYNPLVLVNIKECGDNALEVIFGMEDGSIYSDYPMIPFDFEEVKVVDYKGEQIISNYDELKEWWEDEK